jgi:gas vesicle protein
MERRKSRVRRCRMAAAKGPSVLEERYMASESSGFGWFLVGLGAGAVLGVLYAPKPGNETRDDIASGAREGVDYVRQRSQEVAGQVNNYVEQGRQQLNEYVDRGKEYVDKGRDQWNQYVDRGRQVVNEQTDKLTSAVNAGKEAFQSSSNQS